MWLCLSVLSCFNLYVALFIGAIFLLYFVFLRLSALFSCFNMCGFVCLFCLLALICVSLFSVLFSCFNLSFLSVLSPCFNVCQSLRICVIFLL